jgi:ferredoxin-nitrate reductase
VAEICDVRQDDVRGAARIIGGADRLFSTVLQGVYQSNQATAAACGVNNLHLLRGMLGRPGAGVLQMNGQPTAQNTRETGADGDLPGMRNWDNPEHIRELAELWKVDPAVIPHWASPTHAMQIWRYAEQGSIELLWISGTNPAVSLPDLGRIRRILRDERLLVVVQDLFLTETAELADVVLPGATWGEKTGWGDPESAFEAWKACSRGRPCDYSELSYERLRREGGIQWGGERLYQDAVFNTDPDYAESFGHDMKTGATQTEEHYRAKQPNGRALLHAVRYQPAPERPGEGHPLLLTTGRTVYHFHTRTKTGRAPELDAAAPDAWVELHQADAERLDVVEGELVRVESPRGALEAPARLGGIRPGTIFVPFHYGAWRNEREEPRAANELTVTAWDPVSKQPLFKQAAVRVAKVG